MAIIIFNASLNPLNNRVASFNFHKKRLAAETRFLKTDQTIITVPYKE